MHIIVVGLSHKTTPVDLREQLYFPEAALEGALEKLAHYTEGGERVILSTCNRVEVYAHVQHLAHGSTRLRQFLSDYHGIPSEVIEPYLYTHHGAAALRHLFRVVSSLDSLVVGEPQITAQGKAAFAIARRAQATSTRFSQVFERAFAIAKRVRTATRIGEHAVSVSSAAVELAQKIFQDLDAKTVLIVGAGEMAELTARHLMSQGVTCLLVANRTLDQRPIRLRELFPIAETPLNKHRALLAECLLQAFRYLLHIPKDGRHVELLVQRQDVGQEFHRQPIGHQGRKFGFQIHQLGGSALRQPFREWAPTRRRLRLTVTGVEPWARDTHRPEQRTDHNGMLTFTDG